MCCHSLLLVELSTCYMTILGKDPQKLVAGFLKTLPHVLFPFADFALFHFTVINLSCEYYCMLNPVSPNLGPLTQLLWPIPSFLASPVQLVKPFITRPYHSPGISLGSSACSLLQSDHHWCSRDGNL